MGAGVRGRLAGPLSGQAYELGGRRVQLAPEADGGAWARRRWGLKPLRRHEGPAVQLHLHSPDGEEARLSFFSDIQVFARSLQPALNAIIRQCIHMNRRDS